MMRRRLGIHLEARSEIPCFEQLGYSAETEVELASLMAAAQRGEREPYERLLHLLSAWLDRYFTRCLPASTVDRAVEETLTAIHKKRHTYDPSRRFLPWLSAIAHYKSVEAEKRQR
jgi:DNA-directed RNA polymerase specialized sigma24 family protein